MKEVEENVFTCSKKARQCGAAYHDPYTCITQTVQSEVFERPPYSHDLAPSDYHMFLSFRSPHPSLSLRSEETKYMVQDWLKGLVATFFN